MSSISFSTPHFGWAGESEATRAWAKIGHRFPKFQIQGGTFNSSRTMRLWDFTRKVLGKDTPNYAQQTGDCFVAGTPVQTEHGPRAIEDIRVGDMVFSGQGSLTQVISTRTLLTRKPLVRVCLDESRKQWISPCTDDHQFLTMASASGNGSGTVTSTQTWTRARDLGPGSLLVSPREFMPATQTPYCVHDDYAYYRVHDVEYLEMGRPTPVYDIGVDDEHHSFLADRMSVHNCVSFGAKNAIEYLAAVEIFRGEPEKFHSIFPPYLYGTGRVLVGNGALGRSAGSLGSWQAKAVEQYGVLRADYEGVPRYSGKLADDWGYRADGFKPFMDEAQQRPIQTTARIRNWEDLVAAVCNGYPCTIASNQGWQMTTGSDGYHRASGSWPHQMCITGISDEGSRPWVGILNSWGDVHGRVKDFETGEDWPIGMIRAHKSTIQALLGRSGVEVFAFSQFKGFPGQKFSLSGMFGS